MARREPDALDTWFAMQFRAWWKQWRWAVVPLIALAVLRTAYVSVNAVLVCAWRDVLVFHPPSWQYDWCTWLGRLVEVQFYSAWLLAIAAAFAIAAQARTLAIPQELALACSPASIFRRRLARIRTIAWTWTAGLVYSSVALGYAGYLLMLAVDPTGDFVAFPLDPAMLHVQPALTALILIYLLTRARRLHAGVIAVLALLPAAIDVTFNCLSQIDNPFWPLGMMSGSHSRESELYLIMFIVEIGAAVWLDLAASFPPKGYTGAEAS